uniref:Uncharacterized protein n=1 Tax=Sphaerodactylus townsendi TaxID=933632 RepID=A0ACB8EGW1_9SAUR
MGRRAVCSRPYFVVLMVFAHLYVLNVLGLLLFVHISSDDGGAEPGKEAPSPAQDPPALPFSPGGSGSPALPRLEGIKASTARAPVGHKQKVELIPNKIHYMKTLSLKPLLFGKKYKLLEMYLCVLSRARSLLLAFAFLNSVFDSSLISEAFIPCHS